ncbi:MAG: phosphoserine phosphatase RsbU/P [Acidobacteriota bacterium]|nr:phosphoserine phosphatase RsbU/P [Acidobacteriota bacterium]
MRETDAGTDKFAEARRRARVWLRRVMPRVAIVAVIVFVAWTLAKQFELERVGAVAIFFNVAFLAVYAAAIYYGARGLRWLKNKLLWRVRRRLAITYLFIGLTPIVLLFALAALTGLIGLNQVMTRVVKIHLGAQETQALASARMLARSFARLSQTADERTLQTWLDERTALMQSTLPGARVAVWVAPRARPQTSMPRAQSSANSNDDTSSVVDESQPAQFASEPQDAESRPVGSELMPVSAPLPAWLRDADEWHGLSYLPPPERETSGFGSPSLRALVREHTSDGRALTLLVVVPVSRAFMGRLRENTGLDVHPFFLGSDETEVRINSGALGMSSMTIGDQRTQRRDPQDPNSYYVGSSSRRSRIDIRRDQFGEPTTAGARSVGANSLVILPASNWTDGRESLRVAFMSEFSAVGFARDLFAEGAAGRILQSGLLIVATFFLVLEVLALFSAAWMTRAVTGTVHRLYQATGFIKRGDFSHRVRVRSHDQLGELAEAFNEMSADIESLLEERIEHEKLEREIEIAAEVQAQLFPREIPQLAGAEIVGECRAARGVAGDYYDYIDVAHGLIAFALGDVSGKGISAALVMSNLQASLRAQTTILSERMKLAESGALSSAAVAGDGGAEIELPCGVTGIDTDCAVEQMAASINGQLCRSTDSNRFATAFLALYDDASRRLRYVNCGHDAPLLVRASGTIERLDIGGTVLGAFDWATYEEASATLSPGDLLLLFSDGITEAHNEASEEYGDKRLTEFAISNRESSAEELCRAIFLEIGMWSGGQERNDDQTIVILKARG